MGLFGKRDFDQESQQAAENASHGRKWSDRFWKPTSNIENVIRILPPAPTSTNWYFKGAKHFMRHSDGSLEVFTCMREVYGLPCPVCTRRQDLIKEKQELKSNMGVDKITKVEALQELDRLIKDYAPQRYGLFNIVPRGGDGVVMLWEAPISVWTKIFNIVHSKGRMSNVFDEFADDKGNISTPGRDWVVTYDKEQQPQNKYNAYPVDQCPMGSPDEVLRWVEDMIPLEAEKVAFRIEPEHAEIKAFGSSEERKLLKELLQKIWEEENTKFSSSESNSEGTKEEKTVEKESAGKTEKAVERETKAAEKVAEKKEKEEQEKKEKAEKEEQEKKEKAEKEERVKLEKEKVVEKAEEKTVDTPDPNDAVAVLKARLKAMQKGK